MHPRIAVKNFVLYRTIYLLQENDFRSDHWETKNNRAFPNWFSRTYFLLISNKNMAEIPFKKKSSQEEIFLNVNKSLLSCGS
jgi:hypothetical protein